MASKKDEFLEEGEVRREDNEQAFDNDDDKYDDSDEEEMKENETGIESIVEKLEKVELLDISDNEALLFLKNRVIYSCPRCRKIFFKNKWIKDTVTDIYTFRKELAYCDKCLEKTVGKFIGSMEIYDKQLSEKKNDLVKFAYRVESELENKQRFELIINILEENGIVYIFANTTRLTLEIARAMRAEYGGAIQYEWFQRNQFLRVKWFCEIQSQDFFKKKIRASKEQRIGMFYFEDES